MKHTILICILLMLVSTIDTASARGRKKKTRKTPRIETPQYEEKEIDNFDFLYTDSYTPTISFATVEDIMERATSLIGSRYRSGSKGPHAFDCSGFTSYVFGQYDYAIGCSSRDQYVKNQPIEREEMRRGDLVFFSSPRSGRGVGHVGIIVDVDRVNDTFTFIHASTSEGVTINKSTDGYYGRRYIGVRRVGK